MEKKEEVGSKKLKKDLEDDLVVKKMADKYVITDDDTSLEKSKGKEGKNG